MSCLKGNFSAPTEVRTPPNVRLEVVKIGEHSIVKGHFKPAWKWSTDIKPVAKTDMCKSHHIGCVLSGQMVVKMADGVETTYGPNDVFDMPPNHDAWVVGDEDCVIVDFAGMKHYGK